MFSKNPLIHVIQGDLTDLTPLKKGLSGHTRLFLLYNNFEDFVEKKVAIAKLAYASGIKEILDMSAINASESWGSGHIGVLHPAVLTDDVQKHGDIATPNELATIASRVLDCHISYQEASASTKYDHLMTTGIFTHAGAYHIAASIPTTPPITTISTGIPVLIAREPETIERFISLNKGCLL